MGFSLDNQRRFSINSKTLHISLRSFGDAEELQQIGEHFLYIGFEGQKIPVCKTVVQASCRYCEYTAANREDIFEHILNCHLDDIAPQLSYAELQTRQPELPHEIYKCSYCNFYATTGGYHSPTSIIQNHIEKDCQNADRPYGIPRIAWREVTEIDEIRKHVVASLPRIRKCKLCQKEFSEDNLSNIINHILNEHYRALFELK